MCLCTAIMKTMLAAMARSSALRLQSCATSEMLRNLGDIWAPLLPIHMAAMSCPALAGPSARLESGKSLGRSCRVYR
jgi:hypothetical protein